MESQIQQIKNFYHHKAFWLFATIFCLSILHFYYIWKMAARIPTLLDFLGWASIIFLLWKHQYKLKFRGTIFSIVLGLLLNFWMIARHGVSQSEIAIDVLARFFPLVTITGLLMIVSGFKRLHLFKSEMLIATLISLPFASIYNLLSPIVNLDSQLLAFMLHYIGFKVIRNGSLVTLPNGSVEVMGTCSSVGPILTMLPFVVVLLSIYPASKIKQLFIYVGTIFSIIFVNGIRLSLLAILINRGDTANFDYWHTGGGAGIFSNIIVFTIGGLTYQILNNENKSKSRSMPIPDRL